MLNGWYEQCDADMRPKTSTERHLRPIRQSKSALNICSNRYIVMIEGLFATPYAKKQAIICLIGREE
jgi:hypothetical protein